MISRLDEVGVAYESGSEHAMIMSVRAVPRRRWDFVYAMLAFRDSWQVESRDGRLGMWAFKNLDELSRSRRLSRRRTEP